MPIIVDNLRWDASTALALMAEVNGYCMVRRPRAIPFVLSKKDWDKLPLEKKDADGWRAGVWGVTQDA